jgi:hypothetical protein
MNKTLYSVICQFTGELIDQHDDRRLDELERDGLM